MAADEREAFGTELFTDEDSYFVFYAVYNTNTDQVSDVLDISLMRPAETVEFVCPLPRRQWKGCGSGWMNTAWSAAASTFLNWGN